jgi:anti-sigma regulatory factor (Ser/Thr protein kinase)
VLGDTPHAPWQTWVRYEAAVNHVFGSLPVWGMCPYDTRRTSDDVLLDVERTHPHLLRAATRLSVPSRRYENPADVLAERARLDVDPLEATPPQADLVDPQPRDGEHLIEALAEATRLDRDAVDALRVAVAAVVRNAITHGRPPVRVRAWCASNRIVTTVTDAGPGPEDPFTGLVPKDLEADADSANSLHAIHEAITDVALVRGADGFTVRLVQSQQP